MNARDAILESVRGHLGRRETATPPRPPAPPPVPLLGRVDLSIQERVERFGERLRAVGGHLHSDPAGPTVAALLDQHGAADAFVAVSDSPAVRELRAAPELRGVRWLAETGGGDELFTAGTGITSAQWAIADTGSLVLDGNAERHRLASLVPPIHIALLPTARILCNLGELLKTLDRPLAHAVTIVTGPSRTADIELQLVLGVHGPRELHVILT